MMQLSPVVGVLSVDTEAVCYSMFMILELTIEILAAENNKD